MDTQEDFEIGPVGSFKERPSEVRAFAKANGYDFSHSKVVSYFESP
ncbi:MAG: hypothetical protein AAFO91_06490 [Bacteroidota bacterium]